MAELLWRLSPWDGQVHAFLMLGEVASEAICTHSALTSRLTEAQDRDRRCQGCMLLHGMDLAERHGDRDRYAV